MNVLLKKKNSFSEQRKKTRNQSLIDVSVIVNDVIHFEINFPDFFYAWSLGEKIHFHAGLFPLPKN